MAHVVVDIAQKLSLLSEHWSPKVVARLNDYEIKVVKVKGEFVWHTHDDTDELFMVVDGELTIQLRDGNVTLRPGQLSSSRAAWSTVRSPAARRTPCSSSRPVSSTLERPRHEGEHF